jgi:hypothetical protein
MEVSAELHDPIALPPGKELPVPRIKIRVDLRADMDAVLKRKNAFTSTEN